MYNLFNSKRGWAYIFVLTMFCLLFNNYFIFQPNYFNFSAKSFYKQKKNNFPSNIQKFLIPYTILLNQKKKLTHTQKVLQGCGEICNYTVEGSPSLFFDFIKKDVDCAALWMNEAIDSTMVEDNPPAAVPENMLDDFTYGGKVPVIPYPTFFNQRYLGTTAQYPVWSLDLVNNMIEECKKGILNGNYGVDETNFLKMGLERMSLQNASVLVIGSENPWVEACVLHAGARNVYTLEYGKIESKHPNIITLTPNDFRMRYHEFFEFFDAVVTFSSVEHSGLGRYGDAMNPWGDRQAVARGWCASKPGARMLIAVMTGDDRIEYNAHRVYGKIMYPHLVANWKQLWRAPGGTQIVHVLEKPKQEQYNSWVKATFMGRLGNQLFIVASSYGISRARQSNWCIDTDLSLIETFIEWKNKPISCTNIDVDWMYISENGLFATYLPKMIDDFSGQNVHVGEYLQSYKYFINYSLPFKLKYQDWAFQWCKTNLIKVGIHIRRGDFTLSPKYNSLIPQIEYYMAALKVLEEQFNNSTDPYRIFIASDDINWVSNQKFFQDSKFILSTFGNAFYHDLSILSQCENLIISCGTFGWWAMYMHSGNGIKLYYSKPYFDFLPQDAYKVYDDYYIRSWRGLDDDMIGRMLNM